MIIIDEKNIPNFSYIAEHSFSLANLFLLVLDSQFYSSFFQKFPVEILNLIKTSAKQLQEEKKKGKTKCLY